MPISRRKLLVPILVERLLVTAGLEACRLRNARPSGAAGCRPCRAPVRCESFLWSPNLLLMLLELLAPMAPLSSSVSTAGGLQPGVMAVGVPSGLTSGSAALVGVGVYWSLMDA